MIPIKQFVLAGKAVFTITDNTSGKHYTYRVNKADRKSGTDPKRWFVNLGIGYEDAIYMGMIEQRPYEGAPHVFRSTQASKISMDAPSWRVFQLFWDQVRDGLFDKEDAMRVEDRGIKTETLTFRHEGRCCHCSRPLTNPESIDAGIGPECAGKV